jgi:drug/metabolite transporter (DMT)-like permease
MLKNYIYLLSIGIIWGSQFIFQEIALTSFSPVWIGVSRALIGALTLILICHTLKLKASSNQWGIFAVIGLLEATIPFVFIPWGQQNLTSSTTAILMGTLPFYTLLLAPFFIKKTTITWSNTLSVIVGFIGLIILFYPELSLSTGELNLLSAAAIIIAAICFAVAILLLNRIENEHPLIIARNVLIAATIQLIIVALITTPFELNDISYTASFSLLYLGIMCAGIVYYLYMMCIKAAGAVFASMTNYIVPAVGVLIGATINNESIQITSWVALIVILSALLINQVLSKNE